MKLDPDLRQGDEEEMRGSGPPMTYCKAVMAVLDTAILERTLEIIGLDPIGSRGHCEAANSLPL
jgi:hypothetical protein